MPSKRSQKIIKLSKYAGFCEGVKRAYDIVEKIAKDEKVKKPVFVLGSLVHNQDVVNKIEKLGVRKIEFDGNIRKFFRLNKGKIGTLIIRAHGIGPDFYKFANKNKIDLVDATCPKVKKVQSLAKLFSEKSYQVILIGQKNHKEVIGIYEWSKKKAKIIDGENELGKVKFDLHKKIAIISQTTQNEEEVKNISKKIKNKFPSNVQVFDTLCLATRSRQEEIKKMARENDAMIVIGSPKSANSTHLWEIAKKINNNSFFIEGAKGIKRGWLKKFSKIGVSAGASTPPWVIREVCNFLEKKL